MSQQSPSISRNQDISLNNEKVYDDGYLRVEHGNYYVACGGDAIPLSRTEFLIVSRLARSLGRVVAVDEIWRYAWNADVPFNVQSLRVHIFRLREKLLPFGLAIDTMVNVGYRLSVSRNGARDRRH
ncbi:MAG TPA: winged helix-turn-helix domain-containing protein [Blastocatellia bacterium]|jgi:DNA-binding response OmpR family regulator|nr:winged helix-turn-helix domain-containing protein [Blastocatellia bacterium]